MKAAAKKAFTQAFIYSGFYFIYCVLLFLLQFHPFKLELTDSTFLQRLSSDFRFRGSFQPNTN